MDPDQSSLRSDSFVSINSEQEIDNPHDIRSFDFHAETEKPDADRLKRNSVLLIQKHFRGFMSRKNVRKGASNPDAPVGAVSLHDMVTCLNTMMNRETVRTRFLFYTLFVGIFCVYLLTFRDPRLLYPIQRAHTEALEAIETSDGLSLHDVSNYKEVGDWVRNALIHLYNKPYDEVGLDSERATDLYDLKIDHLQFFCMRYENTQYLNDTGTIPDHYWQHLGFVYATSSFQYTYANYSSMNETEQAALAQELYGLLSVSDQQVELDSVMGMDLCAQEYYPQGEYLPGVIQSYNRAVGGLLLRQFRRKQSSGCGSSFDHYFPECYRHSDTTATFSGVVSNTSYSYMHELGGGYFVGFDLGVHNLELDLQVSKWNYMLADMWLSRATRRLDMWLVTFNPNYDFFGVVELRFEFDLGGTVSPHLEVMAVETELSWTAIRIIAITLYMSLGIFLISQTTYDMYKDFAMGTTALLGLKRLSQRASAYIDVPMIILFFVIFVEHMQVNSSVYLPETMTFYSETEIQAFLGSMKDIHEKAQDANRVGTIHAVYFIILILRFMKYAECNERMTFLLKTVKRARGDLLSFFFVFMLIVFAYAIGGFIIWGGQLPVFKTVGHSTHALLSVLTEVGDIPISEMSDMRPVVTYLFFWSYVVFVIFLLFNVLISIVIDSYVETRKRMGEAQCAGAMDDEGVMRRVKNSQLKRLLREVRISLGQEGSWKYRLKGLRYGALHKSTLKVIVLRDTLEASMMKCSTVAGICPETVLLNRIDFSLTARQVLTNRGDRMLFELFRRTVAPTMITPITDPRSSIKGFNINTFVPNATERTRLGFRRLWDWCMGKKPRQDNHVRTSNFDLIDPNGKSMPFGAMSDVAMAVHSDHGLRNTSRVDTITVSV